jgi:hypothetical protein
MRRSLSGIALRGPLLRLEPRPVFHHARLQPFLDQTHDPAIPHAMLHEPDQPIMFDGVEMTGYRLGVRDELGWSASFVFS